MIAACFNCFTIPFKVAFHPVAMDGIGFTIANGIIDFTFLLDILLTFRTIYIDDSGSLIKIPSLISQNYFKS